MTRLFDRRPSLINGIVGTLVYCLVAFPIFSTTAFGSAVTTGEGNTFSEKKELVQAGVAQYERRELSEARQTLEKAKMVFPENYAIPYYLGLIYLQEGQRSAAIAEWQRYVTMDPTSENAMKIRKDLTLLLREEAQEYANLAFTNEAALTDGPLNEDAIAITPFKNLGAADMDPLGKGMTAMLIQDVSQIGDLQVVERMKLQILIDELSFGTSGLVVEPTAPQLGKLLKAKHVISGTMEDLQKKSLQMASVVVDAEHNETIGTQEVQGALEKFYELEKKIACGIVEDLGKDCNQMPGAFRKIHTKSLPAMVAFSYGLDHFDKEEYDDARAKFLEALDEDPEFDLAQQALLATPFSAMLVMTTSQIISDASASGVSSTMAGSAVVMPPTTGGVGIGATAAIAGGIALAGGATIVALGGDGGDDPVSPNTEPSDVQGNWKGTWTDSEGNSGQIVFSIVQDSTSLGGTASVIGSECISTGNFAGTITTGNQVNLTITSASAMASYRGTYNGSNKTVNGNFSIDSGACAGYTGDFWLTITGGAIVTW